MAKDRRSRDQKRRDKLKQRAQKHRQEESLAYTGNKYRTEKLIPFHMEAEIGIYECLRNPGSETARPGRLPAC